MKPSLKYAAVGVFVSTLIGCSSGDDSRPRQGDDPAAPTPPGGPVEPGTPGSPATPGDPSEPPRGADGTLPPPVLPGADTVTGPILVPTLDDLFFTALDYDPEMPIAGSPPTTPKNLRIDLISNDWAAFSWAPSSDDGSVVEYRVHRVEDGHTYIVRGDQTSPASGTQRELDLYWKTTSFVDCNYTRFTGRVHDCELHGPTPGDVYSYEVTAVDDEGRESVPSNRITIRYPELAGAPVLPIEDPYGDAEFALSHDLTNTGHFLDRFELVFEEEFDAGELDEDVWNTELLWGDDKIINGEQQLFVSAERTAAIGYDPFVFSAPGTTPSTLTIEARPTPPALRERVALERERDTVPVNERLVPDACLRIDPDRGTERCKFLSGALSSHDKVNFLYGYIEGRMKVSGGRGALSSFYLYHRYAGAAKNFHAPEIDILEYLGENPFGDEDAFQNYHFGDTSAFVRTGEQITRSVPTMSHASEEGNAAYTEGFHTFGVLWEPQLVVWYIDGKEVRRLTGPQVSRQPMNIVTYLVAGSGWAPEPDASDPALFPLRYELDWIRVHQREPYAGGALLPTRD